MYAGVKCVENLEKRKKNFIKIIFMLNYPAANFSVEYNIL